MDLTPDELDELATGWVLDALDPADAALIEKAIDADPILAARVAELQEVVALLGQPTASAPPPELRAELLEAATRVTPPQPRPSDPLTLLGNQIDALAELVPTLDDSVWRRRAKPYRWSAHGLMAHLLVIERYTAGQLGLIPIESEDGPIGHLQLGSATIDSEQHRPPTATWTSWQQRATATLDALRRGAGPAADAIVDFHGYPFTVENLLIARAFEIWTHTDDIRRAAGRELQAPSPADLRTMSRLSVTTLPLALRLTAPDLDLAGARMVLTGEGGATFDLGDPADREVMVVADVIDYCRLAARRLTVSELGPTIEGDRDVAIQLLEAAQVMAV